MRTGHVVISRKIDESVDVGEYRVFPTALWLEENPAHNLAQLTVYKSGRFFKQRHVLVGDSISLGDNASVEIKSITGKRVKMRITAPVEMRITRPEAERVA